MCNIASNKYLLWKHENNITWLWCKIVPKLMWNKLKITWGKLSLFTHCWGFYSRKNISKYFKLTQHVSKYFKLTQNISRNLFKSLHNYIMDEQWINFIHYDDVNDDGMILRMTFVTPLRPLKKNSDNYFH
jgi:enoyl-[acyl-carrier-protein] reductase (NADH)